MRNRWLWSVVFLALSIPLAIGVLNRDMGPVHVVRVATFNAALTREAPGALLAALRGGADAQARRIAEIVQRSQVDILLLCELDRDDAAASVDVFAAEYLAVSQNGAAPIDFAFRYAGPVNTGVASGVDLDGDGRTDGPGDAFGFGRHAGQSGMALLSRHPILVDEIRTFQRLPWSAMPGASRPEGAYDDGVWQRLRLSSKSHWDVPVGLPQGQRLHLLCSHPTLPVSDGPEDRNGCRNHDEVRLWVDYLSPGRGEWILDDRGGRGGLVEGANFVVLGDLSCDPHDGDGRREALLALLQHPRVQDPAPTSQGAVDASTRQWAANAIHQGPHEQDTADLPDSPSGSDAGPGNLRLDYVLLARTLQAVDQGVFWPGKLAGLGELVTASDHRLVWVDVEQPTPRP